MLQFTTSIQLALLGKAETAGRSVAFQFKLLGASSSQSYRCRSLQVCFKCRKYLYADNQTRRIAHME